MLTIAIEDPGSADATALLDALSNTLQAITGSSGRASFDAADVRVADARFVVARDGAGRAVGCGAFRPIDTMDNGRVAELKRMYSDGSMAGIGAAILAFLEAEAVQLGYTALRLETRLVNARALAFYGHVGYQRIINYGKYAGNPAAACFEKRLRRDGQV